MACETLALPAPEGEPEERFRELQACLEAARGRGDLVAAVNARRRIERLTEGKHEELLGLPALNGALALGATARAAGGEAPRGPAASSASSSASRPPLPGAAPRRLPRVLGGVDAAALPKGGVVPAAQRFFALEGELEQALDDQDLDLAREMRRRLVIFQEALPELEALARPRDKKLRALQEELEQALDASMSEVVFEVWRRLKVAHAFSKQQGAIAAGKGSMQAKGAGRGSVGGAGGGGSQARGRGRGGHIGGARGRGPGPPGRAWADLLEEGDGPDGDGATGAAEPETQPGGLAPAEGGTSPLPGAVGVEALKKELDLLEWSLSLVTPEEDPKEAKRLSERLCELEEKLRQLDPYDAWRAHS